MAVSLQKMTLSDFLAWEAQQPEWHEFFWGQTYAMVGGTAPHNRVLRNLCSRIGGHLDGTSCQVFAENMKVQVTDGVLYPDVMVADVLVQELAQWVKQSLDHSTVLQ